MPQRRYRIFPRAFFGRRPSLDGRSTATTSGGTVDTHLRQSVEPLAREHPGLSGIVPLRDGRDAFATRVLLADAAERTLDIRYYIWRNDMSGALLFDAVRRAAERGVSVRLLLDDMNTAGLDDTLAALDAWPNVEIRLFNPFVFRRWRSLNYLTDFRRLNRRMHNKSFTADGQVTIIGGRNVGDEYFDADQRLAFIDLDVLAIGPVVRNVCNDFDRYWASESSYPAERILRHVGRASARRAAFAARHELAASPAGDYVQALQTSAFVQDLLAGRLQYEWAPTRMVSDDPAKGLGRAPKDRLIPQQLAEAFGDARKSLQLVSPYLIPTRQGVRAFGLLASRGVALTALTNALEATDHPIVHAGYAKRRRALLQLGMRLYEMKRTAPRRRWRGWSRQGWHPNWQSSSHSSLHAKTFSTDHSRIFVGSLNFDPRSARLNTEMGFVIESETLAHSIADAFRADIPALSYEVQLDAGGALRWIEQRDDQILVHTTEPGTTRWQRVSVWLLSLLPIEELL
jgi:putative cardiolipin synthase